MAVKKTTNNKRHAPKLKIKKGDMVFVIAGAYKNLSDPKEVLEVFPAESRVLVKDVNIRMKHRKATQDAAGGIEEMLAPIHISNLMIVDPKVGTPTRVGRKEVDGKLVRYSKKSGEIIQ
jgi:large subunit ribosomal protein L24